VEVPDSPELLIYKAAILEAMGNNVEAGTVYTKAQSIIQNDEIFTLNRAQVYLVMNNAADTIAILEEYVLENRSSAKAFLLLGTAYELQNDQVKAIEAYEMASEVGNQIEDSTTVAQARIKLAMLMQSFGLNQLETVTPELTP
jgi:predicted Zn-dependent protease